MELADARYILSARMKGRGVRANQKEEYFYFNHIPKTGGTTLRYMLYDYFGGGQIYPNAYEYFIKNRGQYLNWEDFLLYTSEKITDYSLLMGHYDVRPIDLYSTKPKVFSFFRDPVATMISSINYNRIRGRRYSSMTFDEVLDGDLLREGCMQAKHMGYTRKKPNIDQVLANIDNLDCIGIAEQFDRSISLLNKEFGWKLVKKEAKNVSKNKMKLSAAQLSRITEAVKIDRKVYDYALASFENRCRKHQL